MAHLALPRSSYPEVRGSQESLEGDLCSVGGQERVSIGHSRGLCFFSFAVAFLPLLFSSLSLLPVLLL